MTGPDERRHIAEDLRRLADRIEAGEGEDITYVHEVDAGVRVRDWTGRVVGRGRERWEELTLRISRPNGFYAESPDPAYRRGAS